MSRPLVAISLLGTTLDKGRGHDRWERWRPNVGLCSQPALPIDRVELIHTRNWLALAQLIAKDIAETSPRTNVNLHPVTLNDPWDFEEVYASLHDFASTYPFKTDDEDYLIHITTGTHVAQICLFLLTESRRLPGRLAQTSPNYKGKNPRGDVKIIDLDLSKYAALSARFAKEHTDAVTGLKSGIRTRNARFNDLIEEIEHVAAHATDPILLMGPTGAGKSQLARRIYELRKHRRLLEGAFVEVNCATLRGDAAMSALFGHKKGAYTGAAGDRPGLLRAADGGMLFLDEIGELGLDEQAMLLRALEEKRFLPLGADAEVSSQFQLIAGTNRPLNAEVQSGDFREDLLARINLWTFRLPALRERTEDFEPNLDYELTRFAERTNRVVRFTTEAREAFLRFATGPRGRWPGNFRDLSASITRLATLAHEGRITEPLIDAEIARLLAAWEPETPTTTLATRPEPSRLGAVLSPEANAALDPFDRVQLEEVVRVCAESRTLSEAGRELFAASRTRRATTNDADRLRKYLARFGLTWDRVRSVTR
jgi:transcriptional regulatory protein RtcR